LEIYQENKLLATTWIGRPEAYLPHDYWQENLVLVNLAIRPKKEKARISIIKQGEVVKSQELAINWPMSFAGWNIYLTSYDSDETGNVYIKLQLTKNAELVFFWAGSALLLGA